MTAVVSAAIFIDIANVHKAVTMQLQGEGIEHPRFILDPDALTARIFTEAHSSFGLPHDCAIQLVTGRSVYLFDGHPPRSHADFAKHRVALRHRYYRSSARVQLHTVECAGNGSGGWKQEGVDPLLSFELALASQGASVAMFFVVSADGDFVPAMRRLQGLLPSIPEFACPTVCGVSVASRRPGAATRDKLSWLEIGYVPALNGWDAYRRKWPKRRPGQNERRRPRRDQTLPGRCRKCVECPTCKGNGTVDDKYQGRQTCSRCRGVGGFPCIEHG